MVPEKVADPLVEVLAKAGVRQIHGVSGDSPNGITDSIRETKQIQWIHRSTPRSLRRSAMTHRL
jgi:thiamine pyrophosphate-dependent acetolactate synthase large subunit-like protein